jgi:glucose-fructose oxidoreductase
MPTNEKRAGGAHNGAKIRYAVVGLGHIAQVAVLPAFQHAKETSELTALISDDAEKLKELGEMYGVEKRYTYAEYENCLKSGEIDAVYIALPNDMHKEYTLKAAQAGVHILCEKPMAVTVEDCKAMIDAAESHGVKLMIAYRLHFEKTNMTVASMVHDGEIGEPRLFNSTFTLQVRDGNIRTKADKGGGPLFDIGIYCINAARYIFGAEPIEVQAISVKGPDPRFAEIEEAVGAVMRFPNQCLATFQCSFGSHPVSTYRVVGTEGDITVEPAYEYVDELKYIVNKKEKKTEEKKTPKSDQFAPELNHFSECIILKKEPRPNGYEGLADLCVIEALLESAETGESVAVKPVRGGNTSKPDKELIERLPGVKEPKLVNAKSGSQ